AAAPKITFDGIEVSFDAIEDPSERREFMEVPTTFYLPPASIDPLRELGGRPSALLPPVSGPARAHPRARETGHAVVRHAKGLTVCASSSSNALASRRSTVSKPSVNHA